MEKANSTQKTKTKVGNVSSQTEKTTLSPSMNSPATQVMHLQETLGNLAVQRLFKVGKLQAALKIGQPNDVYEQETDRVMRMEAPSLSRKCASCGKREELNIRRKPESAVSDASVPDNFVSSQGAGQPLDRATRDYFEPRFGMDFSRVRVHAGQRASESASSINALAYTLGSNVVFGAGQYQPQTIQGKRLLAHELTHVVQQDHKRQTPVVQRHYRKEADKVAAGLVLRKAVKPVIHRRCAQAAGKAILYLEASGIPKGASAMKLGSQVHFSNLDNKIHRLRIVPTNLFITNSLDVNPGTTAVTKMSSTTTLKGGSIVDDVPAATSGSVHDVIVCP